MAAERKFIDYFSLLAATDSLPDITSRPVDIFPPRPPTPPPERMRPASAATPAPVMPTVSEPEWNPLADVEAAERRQQRREAMRARQMAALGTVEDVQRPDYESPLGAMFTRAWTRYRDVETIRQEAVTQTPSVVAQGLQELMHQRLINEHLDIDLANQNPDARNLSPDLALWTNQVAGTARNPSGSGVRVPLRTRPLNFHAQFYRGAFNTTTERELPWLDDDPLTAISPIDGQTRRPPQRSREDLMLNMACKICLEQPINTIVDPCFHAAMCRWCAQIYKAEAIDETGRFDRRLWKCPICRKQIKEVRRFYLE